MKDIVKIDRSFTQGLLQSSANRAVVASIMTLARGLDVEVTAEGVETQEQLEYLTSEGVHQLQGYLLGKPGPAKEVELTGCWTANMVKRHALGIEQRSSNRMASAFAAAIDVLCENATG